ncbi:hypothetical protein SDC9_114903 [bioreactor metagenome]|uniref:Uncharacterized protein n=1 Tax=bioreactor metagenome TaxID=1076179 RepID=A0A645BRW9_9ZZZZ
MVVAFSLECYCIVQVSDGKCGLMQLNHSASGGTGFRVLSDILTELFEIFPTSVFTLQLKYGRQHVVGSGRRCGVCHDDFTFEGGIQKIVPLCRHCDVVRLQPVSVSIEAEIAAVDSSPISVRIFEFVWNDRCIRADVRFKQTFRLSLDEGQRTATIPNACLRVFFFRFDSGVDFTTAHTDIASSL